MIHSIKFRAVACLATVALLFAVPPSHGQEQQQALIDVLKSDASAAEKAAACRQLKLVGGVQAVPALAKLLTEQELSHEARIALESMPFPEASAALLRAIEQTTGTIRSGIVDSIGERRDTEALARLAKLLSDSDPQVAASAALAIGKIGTSEAAGVLQQAFEGAPENRKVPLGDGLVRCADELLRAGRADDAATIYRDLSQPTEPAGVRAAALRGLVQSAGNKLPEKVRQLLASDNSMIRAAAAIALPDLSVEDLRAVAAEMDNFPRDSQIAMVTAIRFRGDSSLMPLVLPTSRSEDMVLARASIAALGTVAGNAGVDILMPLTGGDDELAQVAWQSLEALRGQDVNAMLARAVQQEQAPTRRIRLIELLVTRNAHQVVPEIMFLVEDDHANVRAAAIAAIQRLATPSDISAVTSRMLNTPQGRDRDELEKAVMLAAAQLPDVDTRTDAVLAAVKLDSDAQKIAVLPTLGRIGGPQALQLVEDALRSNNSERYEAGVRAISNWPDASVAGQLLTLSQEASAESHRVWALRALIRVITLPGDVADSQKLAVLKQAMQMAGRDEERRLVIQRVAAVRTLNALHFVTSYLDEPAFAQDACHSVVELAHHQDLREPNKAEFEQALNKVLTICQDVETIDRAKRYLGQ